MLLNLAHSSLPLQVTKKAFMKKGGENKNYSSFASHSFWFRGNTLLQLSFFQKSDGRSHRY